MAYLPAGAHTRGLTSAGSFRLDKVTYMVEGPHGFQHVIVIADDDKITITDLDGEILIEHTRPANGTTYVGNGRSRLPGQPQLVAVRTPDAPDGIVVVLHGGASRRDSVTVSPTQLSVLRMIPIAKRIARAGKGLLVVYRLLNSSRGWDATRTPVDDVRWALTRWQRDTVRGFRLRS